MSTGRLLTAAIVTLLAIDIFSGKIFPDDQMANSFDCCKGDVDLFDPGCNQDKMINCSSGQSCRFRVSMKKSDSTGRHEHLRNPLMQVTVSWAECVWNGQDDMTCKKVDNRSNYNCTCGRNDKFSKCHPIYMEAAMDKGNHFCPIPNGTDLVQLYQDQIDWNSFPCAYRLWQNRSGDYNNVQPVPRHRDNNDTIESVINTPICRKDLNSDSNFTCSCVSVSCTKAKLLKAIREVWASLSTLTTTEKTKTTTTTTPSTTSTKTTTTTTTSTSTAKISSTITSTPTITSTSTKKTSTVAPTTASSASKISSTKSSPSAKSSTKPSWAETSSPEPFPLETFTTESSSSDNSSLENFTSSSTFAPVEPTVSGNVRPDDLPKGKFSNDSNVSDCKSTCQLELKVPLVLLSFVTLPLPIAALILIVRLIRKIRRRRAKNKAERKRQKNAKLARSCAPPDTTANFSNLTTDGRFKRADPTELPARPAATQLNATVAPTEDLSFSH